MTPELPESRLVRARDLVEGVRETIHVQGASGSAASFVAAAIHRQQGSQVVVLLVATHEEALRTVDDLVTYAAQARIEYLPASDVSPYDGTRPDRAVTMARASALSNLDEGRVDILVTAVGGWIRRCVPAELLHHGAVQLTQGDSLSLRDLAQTLVSGGYQRVPLVEDPGTFSIRGDILDVWPPTREFPIRLEADFERLARLTFYHPDTQMPLEGVEPIESLFVTPARESIITPEGKLRAAELMRSLCDEVSYPSKKARALIDDVSQGHLFIGSGGYLPAYADLESLSDRLGPDATLVVDNPLRVVEELRQEVERIEEARRAAIEEPHFAQEMHYALGNTLDQTLANRRVICLHDTALSGGDETGFLALAQSTENPPHLATSSQEELAARLASFRTSSGRQATLAPLTKQVEAWLDEGLTVVITARVETQAERLRALLEHRGIVARREMPPLDPSTPAEVYVTTASLARGLYAPLEGVVLITEEEIFGRRLHRSKKRAKDALKGVLDDLRSLSPGDFIVHVEHGIGRYLGLEHRTVGTHTVELLVVEYQAGDRLLLPVYRLNQIQKFSGEGAPRLDRLGGQTFTKTKSKVKKKVREIADQLLKLYAERQAVRRAPIEEPGEDYAAFEAAFPYEETPDQAAAIADVVSDLQRETVMDRLVCGDVGFGKTEVALRAAFLAAFSGRQVALLCPTTVLAEQHLRTFTERLSQSGVEVRGLSRFQTKKAQTQTLLGLKDGSVDVVIGTHRLLSKDVHIKNLGLLIVDEEQRFGVTHKERLKELRRTVDVLTLSATPIPRTLNLAVGGLRDMSVIATAPQERRAIRTMTSRFDERIIQSAIQRELERGGQVYYVYNRVEGIYERAEVLKRLLPDARIAVGHGQMSERALEKTMLDFVAGEYDVLCATAIVESGLDIPGANTILIDRADLFGLSQLYQIRGRVGRSSQPAYCYLLVPPDARLTSEARARIAALERYTELGSGFHIATMDMELRGAGELLGADQSGFMAKVGFELFAHMLKEATTELRGETYIAEVDPELSIDVEALLPETYIEDIGVRLSLYKRYALAQSDEDIANLDQELKSRFGSPPPTARRFSEVMRLKTHLRKIRALGLSATAKTATLHLREDTPLDAEKLVPFIAQSQGAYALTPDGRLTRRSAREENGLTHADRILDELSTLAGS